MKRKVLRHKIPWNGHFARCEIVIRAGKITHRYSCDYYELTMSDACLGVRHMETGIGVAGFRKWDRFQYEYHEGVSWRPTTTLELVEVEF